MADAKANGAGNGDAGSHLDWLRARRTALTGDRTTDMDVPGYHGRLVVRYAPVPWKVVAKMQALTDRPDPDGARLLNANCDVLIAACREVLYRDDDGELASVDPTGDTRGFDPRLAELLGIEADTAREVVRGVFPSYTALAIQAGEVFDWTQTADEEADDVIVGE